MMYMQRNFKSKFKRLTTIGLASAMLLTATPLNLVNAEETQKPVVVNTQEVAKQALQSYLSDSNGFYIQTATAEQMTLPFAPELYYGRSLLSEEGQKTWDFVVKELLAFNPSKGFSEGIRYEVIKNGHGKLTFDLEALDIKAPINDIKNFNKYLNGSDARMFHVRKWNQEYTKDNDGYAKTVTFYIPGVYAHDTDYQDTLQGLEAYTSKVLSVLHPRMTDAQKVKVLFDKYRSGMSYSRGKEIGNAVGALTYQKAICGGYSFGFLYVLQRAGLEAIYMTGDTSVGYHGWNYVKVDDEWYFFDTTWGGPWQFKGKSSLTSHNPRKTQHFEPIPELADADYDLNLTKFDYADANVRDNIDNIVQVVKDTLGGVKLSDIKAIVAGNPINEKYAGTSAELAVKNKMEQAFANIDGTFEIVIHNSTDSKTVDDMIKRDLTITYQLDGSEDTYTYKKGEIKKN